MLDYSPPFDITSAMLTSVSEISEKLGRISLTNELDVRPHLRRSNRIRSIHSSLRIEANSLSLAQVRDVIDGHIVFGEQREIQEVKNAYAAYELLPQIDPYDLSQLKALHGVMTKYLEDESGEFRRGEEGVFQNGVCIFMAPPARLVPSQMDALFAWMKRTQGELHPLILSAVFHYEFVFIHPFTDGNGRMARLWHTAILSKWNRVFEYLPIESQIEQFQDEYYAAIAQCHKDGRSNCFVEFMLRQINVALDKLSARFQDVNEQITERIRKLLNEMHFDIFYTTQELMQLVNLRSRESFRQNYLLPALKLGLVEMTVPDKPNSKNQRYMRRQ